MPTLPTSYWFDVVDWEDAAALKASSTGFLSQLGTYAEATRPDKLLVVSAGIRFTSDDGILTDYNLLSDIPNSFTFELSGEFVVPDGTEGNFVAIGVDDSNNNSVYLLLVKGENYALFTADKTYRVPLGFTLTTESINIRIVVNDSKGLTYLYITKTAELPVSGYVQRKTLPVGLSIADIDKTFVRLQGSAADSATFICESFRLSSKLVIANRKPIVVLPEELEYGIGDRVTLDGTQCYDPEGMPLTYLWRIIAAPTTTILSGMQKAAATSGQLTFTAVQSGHAGNGVQVDISYAVEWSINVSATAASIQLPVGTTYSELFNALTDKSNGAYNRHLQFLLEVSWTGIAADVAEDSVTLSGGVDSAQPITGFTASATGTYTIALTVNDGDLDSDTKEVDVVITDVQGLLGFVPSADYIWQYLPDVWRVIKNKGFIDTFWSATIQSIASLLLKAYYTGTNGAIGRIQPSYMRRWVGIRIKEAVPDYEFRPEYNREHVEFSITPINDLDQDFYTVYFQSEVDLNIGEKFVIGGNVFTVKSRNTSVYPEWDYEVEEDAIPLFELIDIGNKSGAARDDNDLDSTTPYFQTFYETFRYGDASDIYLLLNWQEPILITTANPYELLLSEEIDVDIQYARWSIVKHINSHTAHRGTLLRFHNNTAIFENDRLEWKKDDQSLQYHKVLGANSNYALLDTEIPLTGGTQNGDFTYVVHKNNFIVPVNADNARAVPRLQYEIKNPTEIFYENTDYTLDDNSIIFSSPLFGEDNTSQYDYLWAEVVVYTNDKTIENNFGLLVGLPRNAFEQEDYDIRYLSAVKGLMFIIFRGPSLSGLRIAGQIFFNLPFAEESGTITEIDMNYDLEGERAKLVINDNIYYFPRTAQLEDNPATGVTYQIGDTVEQFSPLVKGVEVVDWINKPTWFRNRLYEVQKYHVFQVRADIDVVTKGQFALAVEFVKALKPAYTDVIFTGVKTIHDEIQRTDALLNNISLLFRDDRYTCEDSEMPYGPPPYISGYIHSFDDYDAEGGWHELVPGTPPKQLDMTHRFDMWGSPTQRVADTYLPDLNGPAWAISNINVDDKFQFDHNCNIQNPTDNRQKMYFDRKLFYGPQCKPDARTCLFIPEAGDYVIYDDLNGPEDILDYLATFYSSITGILPRFDWGYKFDFLKYYSEPVAWSYNINGPQEGLDFLSSTIPNFDTGFYIWFDTPVAEHSEGTPAYIDNTPEGPTALAPYEWFAEPPWARTVDAEELTNVTVCFIGALDPNREPHTLTTKYPNPIVEEVERW